MQSKEIRKTWKSFQGFEFRSGGYGATHIIVILPSSFLFQEFLFSAPHFLFVCVVHMQIKKLSLTHTN